MAGDPAGALVLMGMGIDSFSMSLGNLLKIKWVIRSFSYAEARSLLKEALQMDNASQVRARLNAALDERGLGGLVRAGR
jgi:phosphotransferase system enzyme I (PtsP)